MATTGDKTAARVQRILEAANDNKVTIINPEKLSEHLANVDLRCNLCEREWKERVIVLDNNRWCENCQEVDRAPVVKIFERYHYKIIPSQKFEEHDIAYDYFADNGDDTILIDISEPGKPDVQKIINKAETSIRLFSRYIYIDRRLFRNLTKFEEYMIVSITNKKPINSSSVDIGNDSLNEKSQLIATIMPNVPLTTIVKMKLDRGDLLPLGVNSVMSQEIPTPVGKVGIFGYIRLSTVYQTEDGFSLFTQIEQILAYAKYNNYHIRAFTYDLGISGTKLDGRFGLQHIINNIQGTEVLVVASYTRFARNIKDAIDLHAKLSKRGAKLAILDMQIDTNTPYGELIFIFMGALASFESKQIGKRVSTTMQQKSIEGSLRGKPPFGYRFVGKKLPFERVPEEQATIEMIRDLRKTNPLMSLKEICVKLTDLNRPSGSKKKKGSETGERIVYMSWRESRLRKIMQQNKIPVGEFDLVNDVKGVAKDHVESESSSDEEK
jgi:DNA invertase Pin-like site-specific DNA recombinase